MESRNFNYEMRLDSPVNFVARQHMSTMLGETEKFQLLSTLQLKNRENPPPPAELKWK